MRRAASSAELAGMISSAEDKQRHSTVGRTGINTESFNVEMPLNVNRTEDSQPIIFYRMVRVKS